MRERIRRLLRADLENHLSGVKSELSACGLVCPKMTLDNIIFDWDSSKITALVGFGSCCILPPFHQYLWPVTDARSRAENDRMVSQFYHKGHKPTEGPGLWGPVMLCELMRKRHNDLLTNMEHNFLEIIEWEATRRSGWNGPRKLVVIAGREALGALTRLEDYLAEKGFTSTKFELEANVPQLAEFLSQALQALEVKEETSRGEGSKEEQRAGRRKRLFTVFAAEEEEE